MPVRGDTAEQRWQRAHQIAAGHPDPAVRRAIRNRIIAVAALSMAIAVGGVLTGILFTSRRRNTTHHVIHHHPSGIQVGIGVVLVCIGIALAAFGAVRTARGGRGGLRWSRRELLWNSPLMALKLSERRSITRQITGKRPTDPATLDISRDVAARMTRFQQNPTMWLGIAVTWLGNSLINPTPANFVLVGLYALLAVATSTLTTRPQRKARAFLGHNPHPGQETPAATPV